MFGLKCVDMSKRLRWWNLLPLKMFKSRNSTCACDVSHVNLRVLCLLLSLSRNASRDCLEPVQTQKMSYIYLSHTKSLVGSLSKKASFKPVHEEICVAECHFRPHGSSYELRINLSIETKEITYKNYVEQSL